MRAYDLFRHHHEERSNRRQIRFCKAATIRSSGSPLTLRTMPTPAGIISDACHAAVVASLHVTAERLGSARNDRTHHALLDPTEMTGIQTAIGAAMPAQDIGNLDGGSMRTDVGAGITRIPDASSCRWRHLQRQAVERALRRPDCMGGDLRVARRRRQVIVPCGAACAA